MGYVHKRKGSDHAGLMQMIEALFGLVSCLLMLVESMRRGGFFTSRKRRLKGVDDIETMRKRLGGFSIQRKEHFYTVQFLF